jgi:hypothetical protein
MVCRECTAKFAVGLLRCPQCQAVSELYAVPDYVADAEEENMPKITVAAGASNALGADDESVTDVAPEAQVVAEPEPTVPQEEASVEPEENKPESKPDAAEMPAEPVAEPEVQDSVPETAAEETVRTAPKKRAARKTAAGSGTATGA